MAMGTGGSVMKEREEDTHKCSLSLALWYLALPGFCQSVDLEIEMWTKIYNKPLSL